MKISYKLATMIVMMAVLAVGGLAQEPEKVEVSLQPLLGQSNRRARNDRQQC